MTRARDLADSADKDITGTLTVDAVDVQGTVTADGLTVDTNTLYVDSTNNRVGVGTTSPSYLIDAQTSAGNAQVQIKSGGDLAQLILNSTDTTGNSQINFADADSNNIGMLQYFHSDNHMEFTVNSSEVMRIDSSGKVGINRTSPFRNLHVVDSSTQVPARFQGGASGVSIEFVDNTTSTVPAIGATGNDLLINLGASEAARMNSSGTFIVGKNSTARGQTGAFMQANGLTSATSDNAVTLELNRETSDGNIIQVYKDNSLVGSVGANSTYPYIANTVNVGLRFVGSDIRPANSTGADRDNAIDLGDAVSRFKDLHLSGTANVGNLQTTTSGRIYSGTGGNATNPMIANVSDTNTGIHFPAADTMALGTGGTTRIYMSSNGHVGIGSQAPGETLDVKGSTRLGNRVTSATDYTTELSGFGVTSGANRYGSYGMLGFYATSGYTAGARTFALTNAYGATKFAILYGNNSTTLPTVGAGGGVSNGGVALTVDGSGRVSTPNQPAFTAKFNTGTNHNTDAVMIFPTTTSNIGSHYSTSTGLFTAPVSGTYLFTWNLLSNDSGNNYCYSGLQINGSILHYNQEYQTTGVSTGISSGASVVVPLSANDAVGIFAFGAATEFYGGSSGNYTWFSGVLLG